MNINSILVPVDYSDHSLNALRIAIEVAQKFDATLVLLHSHDVSTSTSMSHYRAMLEAMRSEVTSELLEDLKSVAYQFKELSDMKVEYKVTLGLASDDIRQVSKDENTDLIIMGTKGRSNRLKQRFGSISSEIAVSGCCPVLIIPDDCEGLELDKMLLAADYHRGEDLGNLGILRLFALKYNSEVTLLHVDGVSDALEKEEKDEAMEIHEYLEDVKHKFVQVESDQIDETIMKYADNNSIGMIAITPSKHGFFHKIFHLGHTEHITMESKTPVLAVNE